MPSAARQPRALGSRPRLGCPFQLGLLRICGCGPMAAHVALPWIHRLFSNLKRWGLGVYHGLRKTNLQHYLDEFVFRFNRRRTRHAAFDTLLGIGARTAPAPYRVLIRKAA